MGMTSSEVDNDDGYSEDKPFSPMYPVFNFGANAQATTMPPQSVDPLPSYGFTPSQYSEKKGY